MATHSFGGSISNTNYTSYAPSSVYRDGTALPTARLAKNGARPMRISSVSAASAYNAGGISAAMESVAGSLGGGYYSTSGGTGRMRVYYTSGTLYFGRCAGDGGSIIDFGDGSSLTGSIPGSLQWQQAPNAPTGLSASSPLPGQLTVNWVAPVDFGDSALTGYRVEVSASPTFASGVTTVDVGLVLTTTISGLIPGTLYYYRVAAKNAVTTTASTTGVDSATSSQLVLAAARRWDGAAEVATASMKRWDGTQEVTITTAVRWDGTQEVALT